MNLLLLLSALLSAFSGVSGQARVQTPLAASQKVDVIAVRSTAAIRAGLRPVQALPGPGILALMPLAGSIEALPSIVSLLTNRRRE